MEFVHDCTHTHTHEEDLELMQSEFGAAEKSERAGDSGPTVRASGELVMLRSIRWRILSWMSED